MQMVEDTLRLVNYCLQRVRHPEKLREDLFQEGCLALCMAAERYDSSYGTAFSTFAVTVICGAMCKFLRDDGPYHLPRSILLNQINSRRLEEQGYSDQDIIRELNITAQQLNEARVLQEVESIHMQVSEDVELLEFIADTSEYMEDVERVENDLIDEALEVTRDFSQLHRDICMESLCSKLYEDKPITQTELANKYPLSQPHISRVLAKFYKLLKEKHYGT